MNAIHRALGSACMAGAALFCLVTTATAQVVDQSQLNNPDFMAQFDQTDLAQSFQQANNNITGAEIELRAGIGTSGDVTIELWDALPNAGGTLLASGTDFGANNGEFATVSFGGPIPVTPDTTYFLVFTSTNGGLGINGDTNNPYSRGQVYANAGFGSFPTFDYTFQTFTLIPEPSSALALGSLGLLALRRRVR